MRKSTAILIFGPSVCLLFLFGACCVWPVYRARDAARDAARQVQQHQQHREEQHPQLTQTGDVGTRLSYLNDIDEVAWWGIQGNDVYIAFDTQQTTRDDMNTVVRAAAAWASAARGGHSRLGEGGLRARAWGIDASDYPSADTFNPSMLHYFCCAHADEGKVERTEP